MNSSVPLVLIEYDAVGPYECEDKVSSDSKISISVKVEAAVGVIVFGDDFWLSMVMGFGAYGDFFFRLSRSCAYGGSKDGEVKWASLIVK